METDYRLHFVLFFASIVNGVILGLIYDCFRVSRMFFLKNKIVIFFEDLAFSLVCAVSFMILFYNYSFGRMRAYAFLGSIGGFCIYYFTVGRFTRAVCEKVYSVVSPILKRVKNKLVSSLYGFYKQIFTYRRRALYIQKAARGFGLLKNVY